MIDTKGDYSVEGDFYKRYATYLLEPGVRRVHNAILKAVKLHPALHRVADIGCGKDNEFFHYGSTPEFYYGVDQNAEERIEPSRITKKMDYRDPARVKQIVDDHHLTGIVSLYSAELTQPGPKNHAFYETLFNQNPGVGAVYVSGIYYKKHKAQETVGEAGGLTSYQTMPEINRPETEAFIETRVEIPCPSAMFDDCIEVHRLLQRPGHYDVRSAEALIALAPPGCHVETRLPSGHATDVLGQHVARAAGK